MSDPNKDLISQLARRPAAVEALVPEPASIAELVIKRASDWNDPIDTTMADGLTTQQIIQGMIANAKAVVRRWSPAIMPNDWYPDDTDVLDRWSNR